MIQNFTTHGEIRSQYEDFMRHVQSTRGSADFSSRRDKTSITNGFPEHGGGAATAEIDCDRSDTSGEAPSVTASDDDGSSEEGDPDPRPSPKIPSPSGKRRVAAAKAGTPPHPQESEIALWRLPTVLAHIPVSRSHWWAGVAEGRYPAPVKISKRCVAWRSSDIRDLIASF